ncbi:MAG TPA: cation:proton antiporter [Bacillota bacterium]|nr:cation:proton antiporter [Bacillota bacterium]
MLLSLALIILVGLVLNSIFLKIKIPGILAYLLTGIFLGPYVLDLIDPSILNMSADLREIALVIILLRAGLSLDIKDLRKSGLPAILLSFLPAVAEISIFAIIGPFLFDISLIESLILATAAIAVSPAIIIPRMIHFVETKQGTEKQIPQMVLAGSSIEDIFVLVLFTVFVKVYQTSSFNALTIALFPLSLLSGVIIGIILGLFLVFIFKKFHVRDTLKVMIISGTAFLLVVLDDFTKAYFEISGLIAIIALGSTILETHPILASRLTVKFSKVWVGAEIMLFVLVGSIVDITQLGKIGLLAILIIIAGLLVRSLFVYISTAKSNLNNKEKLFVIIAYLPKATVQAAIGSIPLSLGIPAGELILAISVLTIFITAPLGAIGIDRLGPKLLSNKPKEGFINE